MLFRATQTSDERKQGEGKSDPVNISIHLYPYISTYPYIYPYIWLFLSCLLYLYLYLLSFHEINCSNTCNQNLTRIKKKKQKNISFLIFRESIAREIGQSEGKGGDSQN